MGNSLGQILGIKFVGPLDDAFHGLRRGDCVLADLQAAVLDSSDNIIECQVVLVGIFLHELRIAGVEFERVVTRLRRLISRRLPVGILMCRILLTPHIFEWTGTRSSIIGSARLRRPGRLIVQA